MHDSIQYDPIQGQGHEPFKLSWKSGLLQKLPPPPFTMGAGNWPRILKLGHNIYICLGRTFDIRPSFCVMWLWSWQKRQFWRVHRLLSLIFVLVSSTEIFTSCYFRYCCRHRQWKEHCVPLRLWCWWMCVAVNCRLWFLLGNGIDKRSGWSYQHPASRSVAVGVPLSPACDWLCPCWFLRGRHRHRGLFLRIQTRHSGWDLQQLPGQRSRHDVIASLLVLAYCSWATK